MRSRTRLAARQARRFAYATRIGVILAVANRLVELGWIYGESDKWTHGYLDYYRQHFASRRFQRNVILEIGIGGKRDAHRGGGSLRIWRDYFLRSRIIGIDIHPKSIRLGSRVTTAVADQSSAADLHRVLEACGDPDIIIDDGSHVGDHVWASFRILWPRLRSGGLYVIEDLHTSFWPRYGGDANPPERTAVGLLKALLVDAQAYDPTFTWGGSVPLQPEHDQIVGVHVYPGIAFVEKA